MLDARGAATSTARFVCALAVAEPTTASCSRRRDAVEGAITREPRGAGGFGYDPIFFYPPTGLTLAELPAERQGEVSHRGAAFRQLRAWLENDLP